MHSIYKSDIAHFYGTKAGAMQAMVRKSLLSGDANDATLTLQTLDTYPTKGAAQAAFTLHLATSDLLSARNVVDDQLQLQGEEYDLWLVYDMLLGLYEQAKGPLDLDSSGVAELGDILRREEVGAAQAGAWLALLGTPPTELVLLPNLNKRLKPQEKPKPVTERPMLGAYPNPSNGPVYITYTIMEGVEQVELVVHDAQGRLVKRQRLGNSNGIAELQPRELASGIHIASLYFDGIRVGATKLNVVR
jgi:hypothetical protein